MPLFFINSINQWTLINAIKERKKSLLDKDDFFMCVNEHIFRR